MRVYVAVTSVNPLRVYVYNEGLCRFASEKYTMDNVKNKYSHLTNYSINKNNEGGSLGQNQIKWSFCDFRKYLEEHEVGGFLNMDRLFTQIDQIVLKTIISAEASLWNGLKMFLPNTY